MWSSLARDYLAIMASSVSSERAFSQGGITISKWRSRFKGDTVEALQVLKCSIRKDLIFRDRDPSSAMELELHSEGGGSELEDNERGNAETQAEEVETWDKVLDDYVFDDPDNLDVVE